ncbi:cobalamin-5'-phosphate synthase [Porphyromonadaceae bacterium NLAE-zl-C104]|uniref:adenosylcobinamide-GDP ribazoletransferase n=1 Tax=Proteiniphilum saccharofermentans TaxID=1642647 RepID=UPI000897294E|nr:adenosylcobinamide-GDP ribazoletransferase [Proteiniphilum saccharofermentans]SEA25333.1 cobalamin-5'-phosphate synthase [Porphyromonadaceae bacterium KH3R12]SFT10396.1 cobalamin-5'-phosphate synthase [Porphyromonadaceae bacterium NLAE-zl-C104]
MKQQINLFFHALFFYSRIPAGKINYSEENLTKAFRYFPLVGIIVGAIGGGIFLLSRWIFPVSVALVISVAVMVLVTGALHEDGLSDFFDGFGGGRDKERILAIMKESTIGAYGVISLILLFLLKFMLLLSIDSSHIIAVLIASHASSRMMPIFLINSSHYARTGESKAMHTRRKTDMTTFLIALAFGLVPLIFMPWQVILIVIPLYAVIMILLKKYTEKKIGGFTGDVLGALQQFSELAFYLIYVAAYPVGL